VLYDPELTLGLPPQISLTSGINAIAHAAEGLYADDANPITGLMAEEGIAALGRALPVIARSASASEPALLAARTEALYGAWLCGAVLGSVAMALHHKLCHTLGGSFDLPHAATHTAVLPHALAYNASHAPEALRRIARALGGESADGAAQAVYDLGNNNGAAMALRDLGLREVDLDRACDLALHNRYPNPRPLERTAIRAMLQAAWVGARPATSG
jgi:maleylacetate reductase